jgi:hypothetical protein
VKKILLENQNRFKKGHSCTDPAFCTKLVIEKRREFNLETCLAFTDHEKVFDKFKRHILFNTLQEKYSKCFICDYNKYVQKLFNNCKIK